MRIVSLGVKILYIIFLGLMCLETSYAQNIRLEGIVQDSIGEPLLGANLIAMPVDEENQNMTFAITDVDGRYRMNLEKDTAYELTISSIGFASFKDTLQFSENTKRNFQLRTSVEELEEVIIRAKMAMLVEGDKTTYRTDQFKTGNERKLRELLKNLPGVEVDRAGNVTVNGKEVTDFLVDGKEFFGGDTKLGVNNIPAEVVEEVEVMDDYHEVDFMKGLEDSERMAMNIKLKEGKKKFTFGETEVGGGDKDRYYVHPTIFYYSPRTTMNFIGSFNNINESPLSFQDVRRFSGGLNFRDNPINIGDGGLSQFSMSQDVLHKKSLFGAANFSHEITEQIQLDAYSILGHHKSKALTENRIEYLTQDNLLEERETNTKDKGLSVLNNIKLRYKPKETVDVAYALMANVSNSDYEGNISSITAMDVNDMNTAQDPYDFELTQHFRLSSQPKFEHTSEITAMHTYKKENHTTDWLFEKPVFSEIIPSVDEGNEYNFLHDYASTTHLGKVNYKHYWVVHPVHHIYPIAGFYFYDQNYTTKDYQLLEDGNTHSFQAAGFNNDISYQLLNPYFGVQYKFQIGRKLIFRPGAVYQQYFWQVNQFNEQIAKQNKGVVLPEFMMEYKQATGKTLKLNYNLKSAFSDAASYANRYSLTGFNQLYRGSEDLENSLYHTFSANYRAISRLHRLMYNLGLNYNRREKSIRQTTILEGIDQISTSIYSEIPENNYSFIGSISKSWRSSSISFSGQAGLSDYSRLVNNEKIDYQSNNYAYQISAAS